MPNVKHAAVLGNLRAFKDALDDFLHSISIPEIKIPDIELAVEELLVNIMNYSYPDKEGAIELSCEEQGQQIICRITDEGIPFDPTEFPEPNLDGPLSDRSHGGMGIYLARKLIDDITYQRSDNQNILTLIMKKT